ncbi:MAG: hypothetical protein P8N02_13545 [Actinomycetota bacterium]|nr:hypothetical protein [Actinomycetota bacterium]
MSGILALDDLPHGGAEGDGVETWQFEGYDTATGLGVWVEFGWSAHRRSGWYVAVLSAFDGPVVLVVDPALSLAELTPSLEFRAEGIWAQHVCEAPLDHWTLGLEAFGVTLDDPADGAAEQWGTRTAVGLDLEWEAVQPAAADDGGFGQECMVSGEILIADRSFDAMGPGHRRRQWRETPGPSLTELAGWFHVPVRVARPWGERRFDLYLDSHGRWHHTYRDDPISVRP